MLTPIRSTQFKREFALAERRGKNMDKLITVMMLLINERPLLPNHKNHPLHGEWKGKWECHIEGDWVLIYEIDPVRKELIFYRTGSHSDLF